MIIVGTKKMVVFDDMNPLGQLTIYDKGFDVISGDNFEYAVKSREGDTLH